MLLGVGFGAGAALATVAVVMVSSVLVGYLKNELGVSNTVVLFGIYLSGVGVGLVILLEVFSAPLEAFLLLMVVLFAWGFVNSRMDGDEEEDS